jgi:hypothetical protein
MTRATRFPRSHKRSQLSSLLRSAHAGQANDRRLLVFHTHARAHARARAHISTHRRRHTETQTVRPTPTPREGGGGGVHARTAAEMSCRCEPATLTVPVPPVPMATSPPPPICVCVCVCVRVGVSVQACVCRRTHAQALGRTAARLEACASARADPDAQCADPDAQCALRRIHASRQAAPLRRCRGGASPPRSRCQCPSWKWRPARPLLSSCSLRTLHCPAAHTRLRSGQSGHTALIDARRCARAHTQDARARANDGTG